MPTLDWIGKSKVINHHQEVPFRVLEKQYTYGGADSENMIIHGDNLEALKALLPRYEGRVKCIYIDPPYNTGNEGWVYNDNVNDPKIRKWLGEVVGKEGEDLSRHDKWLCMMYPRLKLLQRLLAEDGAIFISISDVEHANLRLICDEIFGVNNFVSNIIWQNNFSPRNDAKDVTYATDNILVYSKNPGWHPKRLSRSDEMDQRYTNPDGAPVPWTSSPAHAPSARTHKGMVYAIQHPYTGELFYPPVGRCWAQEQPKILAQMCKWANYKLVLIDDVDKRANICGESDLEKMPSIPAVLLDEDVDSSREKVIRRYNEGCWPDFYFTANGKGGMRVKKYLDSMNGKAVTTLWTYQEVGTNTEAKNELKKMFNGGVPLDTPKPERLIERVMYIAADEDSIILDSFAGSGTTAHAVLNMNKADGGHRKFILIEMMDYADAITAERVKRVIDGYGQGKSAVEGTGGGFSYYELGEPLLIGENLNESVGVEKIREYIWYTETKTAYDPGMGDGAYYLGRHKDTGYYFYYEPDKLTVLNHDFLPGISEEAGGYVIYADRCALSDAELSEYRILFRKIPRDIKKI